MAAAQPGFFFLFNIVMVLIIWSGTVQISHGDLEVGNLIAFIEYIFMRCSRLCYLPVSL